MVLRTRRAPSPGLGLPGYVLPTHTAPPPFIFAQFLLDGKALSLTDFQVCALGVSGMGSGGREGGAGWGKQSGVWGRVFRLSWKGGSPALGALGQGPGTPSTDLSLLPVVLCQTSTSSGLGPAAPPLPWPVGSTTETSGGPDLSDSPSSGGIVAQPPLRKVKVDAIVGHLMPGVGAFTGALGCLCFRNSKGLSLLVGGSLGAVG